MARLPRTVESDKSDEALPTRKRSKLICASCGVVQAVQRRMVWVLAIAASLTVALTVIAIEWAKMG